MTKNHTKLRSIFKALICVTGTMWENWSLLGGIFVCVPVLLMLKENYNRLTVDESSRPVKVEVNIEHKQD